MKKWEKNLENLEIIIAAAPILTALYCGFFGEANTDTGDSKYIIAGFSLLTTIAISLFLEQLIQKKRWERMQSQFITKMDSLSDGSIRIYEDTVEWINAIDDLLSTNGQHTVRHASLDSAVRGNASGQQDRVLKHILSVSRDKNIAYRHIVRIRHNNLENILDRVLVGGVDSNSIFAYYLLPDNFPFCTFEIIDNEYVATRSPVIKGEIPTYLIIHNKSLVQYFSAYFQELWSKSTMIESYKQFSVFHTQFLSEYSDVEQAAITSKIDKLKVSRMLDND